jgi:hypothetical protein
MAGFLFAGKGTVLNGFRRSSYHGVTRDTLGSWPRTSKELTWKRRGSVVGQARVERLHATGRCEVC